MEFGAFLVWDCQGDIKFSWEISLGLHGSFISKGGVEGYLVVRILVLVEGEKPESIRK